MLDKIGHLVHGLVRENYVSCTHFWCFFLSHFAFKPFSKEMHLMKPKNVKAMQNVMVMVQAHMPFPHIFSGVTLEESCPVLNC